MSSSEEARQHEVETNHQTVRLVEEDREQGLKPGYRRYGISRPTLLDHDDDDNVISTQTSLRKSMQPDDILKLNKGIKAVTIQVRGDKTLVAARPNFVLPDILVSGNFALWTEEFLLAFSEEFVSLTKGPFMSFVMWYEDLVIAVYRQKGRTVAVVIARKAWSTGLHDALEKAIF